MKCGQLKSHPPSGAGLGIRLSSAVNARLVSKGEQQWLGFAPSESPQSLTQTVAHSGPGPGCGAELEGEGCRVLLARAAAQENHQPRHLRPEKISPNL